MPYTGDGQKLIGNDGDVYDVVAGTETAGDGATPLAEGHYLITAVATVASGWPGTSGASGAAQVGVGRIVEVRETDTDITPALTDKYIPLTLSRLCDLSSWNVAFSSDEVEITGFCESIKTYRAGKDDAQGGMSGIYRLGTTDKVTGLAIERTFIDIVRQDGGDAIDVYAKTKGPKIVRLVQNKNEDIGDWVELFAAVELFGFNLGAENGANAQAFDTSFRFTTYTLGADAVEVLPTQYRRARSDENT